ncbi:hypothetical protein PF005_g2103 [Phytophthora fragariae]|uniref:C2 domain-containing protein n=1 Tax=Phytophthora fragariae TaxID=53985 RepID=A0A6A3ZF43_9STRA|nr:hypothetical protein PF003_g35147 [Phytophthora fragariae]KAE8948156.1 hypothetical protein PF009_g2260 [Phytophthora fragariae]KAE9017254.1 hypothetical protein PF011_g6781 [Phytophthora fragariae]KAE9124664.1 hypothetical protein PF010_g5919 [Phytophthora fragariae]KAE9136648.1 hypothetical protein PF007_g2101 [Phytophthora fragariae]
MSSYGQDSFTLTLLVQSGQHLSTHTKAAFCTVLVWSNSSSGGPSQLTTPPKYTSFRSVGANSSVEWNEQVQVPVTNPAAEVLTVRVKDSSDSFVGSCNIYLAHLRPEEALNQWFQLHPAGHIHLKVVLNANQRFVPNPNSPYSADFQMLLDLEMKKRAATVNESPLPSHIAALLEARNKEQQQTQPHYPTGFPTGYSPAQPQQASGSNNFHEMLGTAANISTIAANLQQLNGNAAGVDTSGLGTVASVALGAVGLGPLGLFFGSS